MAYLTEARVAYGFGLLGGVLLLVGALFALVLGAAFLVGGHVLGAAGLWMQTLLLVVFGLLALFFTRLGFGGWSGHPLSAGVMLLVVAMLAAITIGFGVNIVAAIGVVFVALAGILYVLEPAIKAAERVVHM